MTEQHSGSRVAAIVSGGASGLGAATAKALAERGHHVAVFDLPASIETVEKIPDVQYFPVDVVQEDQVEEAVAAVKLTGAPLRIAVNCAGVSPSARILGRSGPHSVEMFRKVLEVNLLGTFNVLTKAAAAMAENSPNAEGERGVIINTASIAAFEGQIGQVAYASSKSGVVGMTLAAARDLASAGIRVCTIAPGLINTPLLSTIKEEFRKDLAEGVPFPQRLGTPEDYTQLALTIIDHPYLNGETIRMDGALRMAPR